MNKVKVIKTRRLNQRKLQRMARKFAIAPIVVRELQLGYVEELDERAAAALIKAGYVRKANAEDGALRTVKDNVIKVEPVEITSTTVDDDFITTDHDDREEL